MNKKIVLDYQEKTRNITGLSVQVSMSIRKNDGYQKNILKVGVSLVRPEKERIRCLTFSGRPCAILFDLTV